MAKGCDTAAYLTDSRVDALVGKGYSFVGRYIDYLKGAHNDLTEKEVGLICNAGLEIVSLYQPKGMNSSTHYSASQGKSDVANATAWQGSSSYTQWNIKQKLPISVGGIDVDPCESSSSGTGGWRR